MKQKYIDRIFDRILFTTDCWEWQGTRTNYGHGCLKMDGKTHLTHRIMYELFQDEIPKGLQIDHLCRNPPCCNPAHLEPVTPSINALRGDVGKHGKQLRGKEHPNSKKTHCKNGHEFILKNTIMDNNKRKCRICHNKRASGYYYKRH